MPRSALSTRTLATATLWSLASFPGLVVVLHLIQRTHYSPMRQAVSELALGRDGWLMAVAFTVAGAGMLGFAALLRRTAGASRTTVTLLVVSGLLTVVSAVFHADGDGPSTVHGQIHQAAGILSFVTVVAVMLSSSRHFRRQPRWQSLARPSLLWGLTSIGTFFLVPALGTNHFGLAQRIFLTAWLSWPITVTAYTLRTTLTDDTVTNPASSATQTA